MNETVEVKTKESSKIVLPVSPKEPAKNVEVEVSSQKPIVEVKTPKMERRLVLQVFEEITDNTNVIGKYIVEFKLLQSSRSFDLMIRVLKKRYEVFKRITRRNSNKRI